MRDFVGIMGIIALLLMMIFGMFCGIVWVGSYQQAQYIRSHYNIEVSTKDIFWNEKLVMSELRSKGIAIDAAGIFEIGITDNNVKIIKE